MPKMIKHLAIGTMFAGLLLGAIACQQPSSTQNNSNNNSADTEQTSASLPGAGKTIQPGRSNIQEHYFQTEIINKALEKLGYDVEETKEITSATKFLALSTRDVDYISDHWETLQTEAYNNAGGDEKLAKAGVLIDNGLQGYQIDKKTADEHNITSLDQLKDPEIAKLFDSDGDGTANLVGCKPGWTCETVIEHHLDAYGLRDTVEHEQGEYFVLIADMLTRHEQGESILFYTWTPLWVNNVLKPDEDTIWMEVPFTDLPEAQKEIAEEDTTANGKNLGFAVDRVRITANKEFIEANPAATKLFELIKIPIDDVSAQNQLMREGEDDPEDLDRHVNEWIGNNQELFDSWVEEAAKVGA